MDRLPVIVAHRVGDDHICAQGDADEKVQDQSDDRTVGAHGGNCRRGIRRAEFSHHRDVRCVEKLLQDAGCRHRQGIPGELIPDGTIQHIDFMTFHVPRSLPFIIM